MRDEDRPPALAPSYVEAHSVELFDRRDPRSVVNLVTPEVADAIERAGAERPELFGMDDITLMKRLKADGHMPNAVDNRIRIRFWEEYDRAQSESRPMRIGEVLAGVCTRPFFYQTYLKRPDKVAWLMAPPSSYIAKMHEALDFGLDQLRDILEQPHVMSNGKVDSRLAELKAKIVAMMDIRVKGAITQKTAVLNVTTSDKDVAKAMTHGEMSEIQDRLARLRERDRMGAPKVEVLPPEKEA